MSKRMLSLATVLVAWSSFAQVGSVTDETGVAPEVEAVPPSPCCAAGIIPAGHFEIETNYSGDAQGTSFDLVHGSNLILKYSLTDHLQLQLATANMLVWANTLGGHAFDGVSLAGKYVLLDESDFAPTVSTSLHVSVPTRFDGEALQQTIDLSAWLYASKTFGKLVFDATLTFNAFDLAGTPAPRGGASLTATWNFNDVWGTSTGPWGFYGDAERVPVDGGWWVSLNINPIPQIAFSAGVEAGFLPTSRAFGIFAGVAVVPTSIVKNALAQNVPATPPVAPTLVSAR
ncbi:MAG: hypothetical protein JNM69_16930 [Archangium sp.]|nr:hypothetical protein [Archangium sp.]